MPALTKKQAQAKIQDIVGRMRARSTAAADDSDSAKGQRREHARADRLWGLKYYFPHYFDALFAELHKEIIRSSRVKGVPTVLAGPRGSGKSTTLQCNETLKVGLAEDHFLIIGSQTDDLATGHTIPIRLELEENPRFIQDFGDLRSDYKWEEGDFITKNQVRVLARGIGQKVRGLRFRQWRPSYFRLDDPEDDTSAANPKRVKKLLKWLTKAVIPAGAGAGLEATVLFIGTIIERRCAIDLLLHHSDYSAWRRRIFPAITEDGKSYWSEHVSLGDLGRIRRIVGTKAFLSEWMQDPRDEEGDFQEEWLRYYHPAELLGLPLVTATAIDPSIKEDTSACYKAIITVSMDPDGIILVRDAFIRHCSINKMILSAYARHDEFNPGAVGLETVAGQKFLVNEFNREAARKGKHILTHYIEQKENKEVRIKGLGPLVERGVIRFQKDHSDQNLLVEQLLNFPNDAMDGPDALEMAVRMLEQANQTFEYQTVEPRRSKGWGKGAW